MKKTVSNGGVRKPPAEGIRAISPVSAYSAEARMCSATWCSPVLVAASVAGKRPEPFVNAVMAVLSSAPPWRYGTTGTAAAHRCPEPG